MRVIQMFHLSRRANKVNLKDNKFLEQKKILVLIWNHYNITLGAHKDLLDLFLINTCNLVVSIHKSIVAI
jgi:hypothetical protein